MLSTSTDGLFPAKKLMMIAFSSPVRIGFVPQMGETAPAMTPCQVTRLALPAAVLCWFEIGGPGTTNSKCMAIGTPVPHVDTLQPLTSYSTVMTTRRQSEASFRVEGSSPVWTRSPTGPRRSSGPPHKPLTLYD